MPKVVQTSFTVKHPDKWRNSFSILVVKKDENRKREADKLEDPRINSINAQWKNSNQSDELARELLTLMKEIRKELLDSQRKRDGRDRIVKNSDNQKILDKFFEDRFDGRKDITSAETMKLDFNRAVLLIGNISLKTATAKEIQKKINKIEKVTLQRRVCSRVNSLLGYLGRPERVRGDKYKLDPFFLRESEFLNLYPALEGTIGTIQYGRDIQNLFIVLYYTGMRMGEAFALQDSPDYFRSLGRKLNYIDGNQVAVNSQMLITGEFSDTKTRNIRVAYMYPNNLMNRIQEWVDLDIEKRKEIRALNYTHVLQKALRKSFGNKYSEVKRMKPHDCRHSYAVNMLSKGVNISLISKILGNGVSVCEKYYLQHVANNETVDLIDSIVKQNTKKPKLKVV